MQAGKIRLLAFDADDTLWHNETLYHHAQEQLVELLRETADASTVGERLLQTEKRNIPYFGYGIKSFTLSMIETAVSLTDGRMRGEEVLKIIGFGKQMLQARVELFEHAEKVVSKLSKAYPLMLITKGDLIDQGAKLERSGLAEYFRYVEIVSEKTVESYRRLLQRYQVQAESFMMVRNSLRSDVLPVVELGGMAVYIPYHLTWAHEMVEAQGQKVYFELQSLAELEELVRRVEEG